MTAMNRTCLYQRHLALGAKMTEFNGWEMPLYYTSILDEHRAVRESVGLFDISHMGQVLVTGAGAVETLNALFTSDVSNVGEGRACYTLMLNEQGGILDDLIFYRLGAEEFLVIVNCANRASDFAWMKAHCGAQTEMVDISEGRGMLAVQGPGAARLLESLIDAKVSGLARFGIAPVRTMGPDACIARTGYTGSDGFELFLPEKHVTKLWDTVLAALPGVHGLPVGLGARDTLRVEAGLRLYGSDMDAATSPYEVGLNWTVAIHKPAFIGKEALLRQQALGLKRKFVGFELAQGPVPRHGCALNAEGQQPVGAVTSGTYSPVLNRPLGMGYVAPEFSLPGTALSVTVRSQRYAAIVVKLPFWKPEAPAAGGIAGRTTPHLEKKQG